MPVPGAFLDSAMIPICTPGTGMAANYPNHPPVAEPVNEATLGFA